MAAMDESYDPLNPTTNLVLVTRVLFPRRTPLESQQAAVEKWERDCRLHADRTDRSLGDE